MPKDKFDAFVSYSHALDGKLAPVVQGELERFAKPWYRMRALRVFRDAANLSASPGLWSAIERALASSEWFVLMASPEAARSEWVNREVAWWVANRSPNRLLLAVTSGDFVWDKDVGDVDFKTSTAVPPALRGVLAEEPRWIDLRWLRDADLADASNPRLRESVTELGSAIRDMPKDLLIGEHVRRHRQAMRHARLAIGSLATLLVFLLAATVYAVIQSEEAQSQTRTATAQLLAATAIAEMEVQADRAQLLAVEGYRMQRNPRTAAALLDVLTASPHLVRQVPVGATVTAVSGSADGNTVVAGTDDGRLLRWRLDTWTLDEIRLGHDEILSVAISADGGTTLAVDGTVAVTWKATGPSSPLSFEAKGAVSIAVSPSGALAAMIVKNGNGADLAVALYDPATGSRIRATRSRKYWSDVGMPNESTVILAGGTGAWERMRTSDLSVSSYSDDTTTPAGDYAGGGSAEASYFGYIKYRQVVLQVNNNTSSGEIKGAEVPVAQPELLTIRNDGKYVAASGGGTLWIASTADDPGAPIQLTGSGRIDAMAFVGNSTKLVSAAADSLALWDISQHSRLSRASWVDVPEVANVGPPPRIAVTRDGKRVAVLGGNSDVGAVHTLDDSLVRSEPILPFYVEHNRIPLWSADGKWLWLVGAGGATRVLLGSGPDVGVWPAASDAGILAAGVSADGRRAVFVEAGGGLQVRRTSDGAVLKQTPGAPENPSLANGLSSADLTVAAAVSADARNAAVVQSDTTRRVVVTDVESLRSHELAGPPAQAVTFGEGYLLVVRENGDLEVWDQEGTARQRTVAGDAGYAVAIAVVPGTGLVVRLRSDGRAVVIDIPSGVVLGSLQLPPMTRGSTASPWHATSMVGAAGTVELLTATSGGSLVRWPMNDHVWLQIACQTAGRNLTVSEWRSVAAIDPPEDLSCGRPLD
ncbi:TIR domain-containing protein [Micromonospora sp. WMMC415]|uniref:TIR domain-containing protein n=1 Tax=Micromonospora sp. WMMC415 TaxID=2675222 RepID=UPI001E376418|nr:TIR domain-containing protein [Micromonospora sp. WMMC415]